MNIHEYQAKEILKRSGIAIPQADVADSLAKGLPIAEKLGFPLVIKAQVHAGGRGKAGAIRIVKNLKEFESNMAQILQMKVKGLSVNKVLIEKALDIESQFYLGITVNRLRQSNVIMFCLAGGVDIEETASTAPKMIKTLSLANQKQLDEERMVEFISSFNLARTLAQEFFDLLKTLVNIYMNIDAQLLEINPLVLTKNNQLVACDVKIIIDDNALFRQENLKNLKEEAEDNALEIEAHLRNLAYVKLSGPIGIIGNGAGLVMATMDEVKKAGANPANFLDIGGGAKKEVMQNALDIIYQDKEVKGIFINIFGGITRCDEVAKGILEAVAQIERDIPVVLRLAGTQCEQARELLKNTKLISVETMQEGAKKIVELTVA